MHRSAAKRRAHLRAVAAASAASANFPVLLLSVLWKDCTTKGAVIGGFLGLTSSVLLTIVSPSVWEATFGNPKGSALFPYTSPALFSMAIGFIGIWLFSVLDKSKSAAQERAAFPAQQVRAETGFGAAKASVTLKHNKKNAKKKNAAGRQARSHSNRAARPVFSCRRGRIDSAQ